MMATLKLPQIPDRTPVRHVIQVPPELDRDLHAYAAAYAESYGSAPPVSELIPAMLAHFLAGDRYFAQSQRSRSRPS
jgi:hypothetical protein